MSEKNLIRTGIEGLDAILLGGIPRGNVTLVQGAVGTGKTLLGLEFIYRAITEFDEPGIIVVFETSPDKLIRDAASFGWDLPKLQSEKKLQIVFTSPQVLDHELRSPDSLLLETAVEMGARRIFIDGIGLLRRSMNGDGPLHVKDPETYRELLQQLVEGLNRNNLTALLTHELGTVSESLATAEAAGFVADTVIQLNRTRRGRSSYRGIEIIKSRGQNYVSGEHTLRISPGKGLEVFRRVQAPVAGPVQPTSTLKRSVTGLAALDTLIGGGLFDGSTTMVIGVSGVGKTVLGTHLLREGALQHGKRGLLVSLDEHPAQIVRNAETLGFNLQEQIDAGTIHVMFESPQELDIDAHYARIIHTIEKYDIQRLVIDGTTSYSIAIGELAVYRDFFHALVAYSKHRLMTTFFNYENPEFLGISTFMPDFPVSSIVDNIILLSQVEVDNSLRRCLTVVKARGSAHQFDSREYVIGKGGINLVVSKGHERPEQPLPSYSSLLSRAPTRVPVPRRRTNGADAPAPR